MSAVTVPGFDPLNTPTYRGLRDVFVKLWTVLDEASFRSAILAKRASLTADDARAEFQTLATMTDQRTVYGQMQRLLVEAGANYDDERTELRATIRQLMAENQALRAAAAGGEVLP